MNTAIQFDSIRYTRYFELYRLLDLIRKLVYGLKVLYKKVTFRVVLVLGNQFNRSRGPFTCTLLPIRLA